MMMMTMTMLVRDLTNEGKMSTQEQRKKKKMNKGDF